MKYGYKSKSFTLIELLIVIVIIALLAVALIPRLTGAQAKARDIKRIADLKQIQTALEMYANDNNGLYPIMDGGTNGWRGSCSTFDNHGISGSTGRIPNLAPKYLSELPLDPKPKEPHGCYVYRSINGIDYMVLAYTTAEGIVPVEFQRPKYPTQKSFAIYTPGATMW